MGNFLGKYKLLQGNVGDRDFCMGKHARYWESFKDFSLKTVPGTDGLPGEFFHLQGTETSLWFKLFLSTE